jgi:hypothetical protein
MSRMAMDISRIRFMPLTGCALHSCSLWDSTNGSRIAIAKSDLPDSLTRFAVGLLLLHRSPIEWSGRGVGHYLLHTVC